MPFQLRDFQDLVRLLREHPDWRRELAQSTRGSQVHGRAGEIPAIPRSPVRQGASQTRAAQGVCRRGGAEPPGLLHQSRLVSGAQPLESFVRIIEDEPA